MFERYTERARQVIVLAQEEARGLKHNFIGAEHLLLGLVREEDGTASRMLRDLGYSVAGIRSEIERVVGRGEGVANGQIPFTPRAQKVLELALREALSLGQNYIATEHILLGMIREGAMNGEGEAIKFLTVNVTTQELRTKVMDLLTGPQRSKIREPSPFFDPVPSEAPGDFEDLFQAAEKVVAKGRRSLDAFLAEWRK